MLSVPPWCLTAGNLKQKSTNRYISSSDPKQQKHASVWLGSFIEIQFVHAEMSGWAPAPNKTFHPMKGSAIPTGDSHKPCRLSSNQKAQCQVTFSPFFMCANQCIHQRHAEPTDRAAPTFRISKAGSFYSFARMQTHTSMQQNLTLPKMAHSFPLYPQEFHKQLWTFYLTRTNQHFHFKPLYPHSQ